MTFAMTPSLFDVFFNSCEEDVSMPQQKKGAHNIVLKGTLKDKVDNGEVAYIASCPPDHMTSFSGSGLPFPNPMHAFENTPNKGRFILNPDNSFSIELAYPNSFYSSLGTVYNPPMLYFCFVRNGEKIITSSKLGNGIPFRSLTYPNNEVPKNPRSSAMFYNNFIDLPVRSQEEILLSSAYPHHNKMPENFWGLRPAV
jgi:hypothetical protein